MKPSAKQGSFSRNIYRIVKKIPEGRVMTYGQIAALVGRPLAAKMVGFAMSRAPSGLPCHRVVNRLGEMAPGGIFGTAEIQRQLLEGEGVIFLENGRIDLTRSLWTEL